MTRFKLFADCYILMLRNALSLEMLTELSSAFYSINETKEARSVLLSAEGNVFSAGHNLKV